MSVRGVRKQIAVLMGQTEEKLPSDFIGNFAGRAEALGFELSIFAVRMEACGAAGERSGDAVLLRAVNFAIFDAVLVLADRAKAAAITESLRGGEGGSFFEPLFFADGNGGALSLPGESGGKPMEALLRYLEEDCGYREFALLCGGKRDPQTEADGERNESLPPAGSAREETTEGRGKLTREEKKEYRETMHILDHNLFHYYFQPIVSAEDGATYSYEALMRPDSALSISPLKLLRYAQMSGRLYDVERFTLTNVLRLITTEKAFEEKKVFINSIPGVQLSDADRAVIEKMMETCADNVVIEITEQAELGDEELENLKNRYRRLGTRIALDDYGMGYSNAGNLLRYMPDIVKIDRSLLSDIEKNRQKQHFTREIIDFCHDNGMLALAEGVETAEELRTVIRFGADLIQGYYTGRPEPEPVGAVLESIRSEIRRYQQERQDGSEQTTYFAGRTECVQMRELIRDGITHIRIGDGRMACRDISFIGVQRQRSNLHIRVEQGYEGAITLENVSLSNIKNRPCIDIGEGARVTLLLVGSSNLTGNGIRVQEGSELRIEGDGSLQIRVNADDYYGIGAGLGERHGRILCAQDGEIRINANGDRGVCIGSGLGGSIEVSRGRYILIQSGENGVSVGSFEGDAQLIMQDCAFSADVTVTNGVVLGSLHGRGRIFAARSAIRIYAAAKRMTAIGTLSGISSMVQLFDGNFDADLQTDEGTGLGSLSGASEIEVSRARLALVCCGSHALALGGAGHTTFSFDRANVRCEVRSEQGRVTNAEPEDMHITESSCRFVANEAETIL